MAISAARSSIARMRRFFVTLLRRVLERFKRRLLCVGEKPAEKNADKIGADSIRRRDVNVYVMLDDRRVEDFRLSPPHLKIESAFSVCARARLKLCSHTCVGGYR